jgi:hypothetical protein
MVAREVGRRDDCKVYKGKHTGFSGREAEATLSSVLNGFYFILTVFSHRDGKSNRIYCRLQKCLTSIHIQSAAAPAIDTAFSANFLILSLPFIRYNLQ